MGGQTKTVNKIKQKINSLWTDNEKDVNQMNDIHAFWDRWNEYDPLNDDDDDDFFEEDEELDTKAHVMLPQVSTIHSKFGKIEQDVMKADYIDFTNQYRVYTKKYQLLDNMQQIEENKQVSNNNNEESKYAEDSKTKPTQLTSQQSADPDNIQRIIALKKVSSAKAMDKWLEEYKNLNEGKYGKCTKFFKRYHWKKDVSFKLPMNEWRWQQVVSFIECNEHLKHFSSIFYEYQIDGQELCALNFRTFEYLIEKALISAHNIFEDEFYKFKRMKKEINKEWQLSKEIAELLQYISRGRIQS